MTQLTTIKGQIKNWDTVLFTLFYHDIVYYALKKDHEEKSAALAESRLKSIAVPQSIISNCIAHILATKQHLPNQDADTNYFTGADLSILGADWETYSIYRANKKRIFHLPYIDLQPREKESSKAFFKNERDL